MKRRIREKVGVKVERNGKKEAKVVTVEGEVEVEVEKVEGEKEKEERGSIAYEGGGSGVHQRGSAFNNK